MKTTSDAGVQAVLTPAAPVPTAVHTLLRRQQPNPWKVNLPRLVNFDGMVSPAVERTVWQLDEVLLVRFKREKDRDIHLIVRDPDPLFANSLITVEFPDVACQGAINSPFKAAMLAARQALIAACGNPPQTYKNLKGTATITGAGFFDKEHGAPSTIELHPAFSFVSTCQ